MKTLKNYYRDTIKNKSAEIKQDKAEMKTAQRASQPNDSDMQSQLVYSRSNARYLYLAYATIRGRDLAKVERNPRKMHDKDELNKMVTKMQAQFDEQVKLENKGVNE